ncbi:TPA: hypothetical protein DEB04_02865 [Candidatus Giovannonibacteria bacterium]|nr:MAG: hypothetical protein A3D61_00560 [Candidatus Giovannonibacteria bacterium RIFCSPHIGHO2_02_FULL_48_15]OGF96185.1 MAG: hypothetical protein A2613_01290 [Candidatus Giovannonibacteria bacterium RIFOXYD1_FULL_48_21]HBT81635.1 hypothetical protein [Candidatus Giovannonibacteria bacterium]
MSSKNSETIFISLSSMAVFKNLFFFPGSVFDQLKKMLEERKNLKIVLLLPDKVYYGKYSPFFSSVAGEQFAIEVAPAPAAFENFFQKVFYFFFSYLIYTDATRVFATLGFRPDEPPAGGKRYLAPVKWFIANTFGRFRIIKVSLIPFLFYRVSRQRPFSNLFEKYKPDLVFTPHIYGRYDMRLLAEAKRSGVKTLGMISGWDHFDKYFLPFRPDVLLAQSAHIKKMAVNLQCYEDDGVKIVGYPHHDFISDERYKMSRGELLKSLDFPENARYLLYISGSVYSPDEPDVIETMLRWIDEGRLGPNLFFVIRPYLGGRGADRNFDKKKFERFEEHPRVRFYKREFWGDLEKSIYFVNILRHSSVTMTMFTTAMLEAMVFDVPMLINIFDGYHKRPLRQSIRRYAFNERFEEVFATGAPKVIGSFEELFSALDAFLKNPKLDSEKRERFRDKVLYKSDGLSSQRVIEHIKKALYG